MESFFRVFYSVCSPVKVSYFTMFHSRLEESSLWDKLFFVNSTCNVHSHKKQCETLRNNRCESSFCKIFIIEKATYAVNWCSPCYKHKHHNAKQIVSILTFELERPLQVKVDEVGLLLRHLYGYNSVSFLKQGTPLKLPRRLNLVRISCCFENTRHLTQTMQRKQPW